MAEAILYDGIAIIEKNGIIKIELILNARIIFLYRARELLVFALLN